MRPYPSGESGEALGYNTFNKVMKIDFKHLDHIMICFPEGKEKEARAFYSNVLGLEELPDPGYALPKDAVWYQIGNIQLHIRPENHQDLSRRHPAFVVSSLENSRKILESNGIAIKNESPLPGRSRFSFRDPFGNNIELIEIL
ncbi:VOC family protein [Dyadobacter sp. 32]|uniref:VOC family protein n=1 Tax=Dyadobacter sp. 32 TaxID=538966 RepID=UPI0039C6A435